MSFSFDDVHRFEAAFQKLDNTYNATQLILDKVTNLEENMATLAENLTSLSDMMAGLEADVQRVLAAMGSPNVTLDAEAQAAVDALAARFGTLDAAMDAAVPETPTP